MRIGVSAETGLITRLAKNSERGRTEAHWTDGKGEGVHARIGLIALHLVDTRRLEACATIGFRIIVSAGVSRPLRRLKRGAHLHTFRAAPSVAE